MTISGVNWRTPVKNLNRNQKIAEKRVLIVALKRIQEEQADVKTIKKYAAIIKRLIALQVNLLQFLKKYNDYFKRNKPNLLSIFKARLTSSIKAKLADKKDFQKDYRKVRNAYKEVRKRITREYRRLKTREGIALAIQKLAKKYLSAADFKKSKKMINYITVSLKSYPSQQKIFALRFVDKIKFSELTKKTQYTSFKNKYFGLIGRARDIAHEKLTKIIMNKSGWVAYGKQQQSFISYLAEQDSTLKFKNPLSFRLVPKIKILYDWKTSRDSNFKFKNVPFVIDVIKLFKGNRSTTSLPAQIGLYELYTKLLSRIKAVKSNKYRTAHNEILNLFKYPNSTRFPSPITPKRTCDMVNVSVIQESIGKYNEARRKIGEYIDRLQSNQTEINKINLRLAELNKAPLFISPIIRRRKLTPQVKCKKHEIFEGSSLAAGIGFSAPTLGKSDLPYVRRSEDYANGNFNGFSASLQINFLDAPGIGFYLKPNLNITNLKLGAMENNSNDASATIAGSVGVDGRVRFGACNNYNFINFSANFAGNLSPIGNPTEDKPHQYGGDFALGYGHIWTSDEEKHVGFGITGRYRLSQLYTHAFGGNPNDSNMFSGYASVGGRYKFFAGSLKIGGGYNSETMYPFVKPTETENIKVSEVTGPGSQDVSTPIFLIGTQAYFKINKDWGIGFNLLAGMERATSPILNRGGIQVTYNFLNLSLAGGHLGESQLGGYFDALLSANILAYGSLSLSAKLGIQGCFRGENQANYANVRGGLQLIWNFGQKATKNPSLQWLPNMNENRIKDVATSGYTQ